MIISVAAGSTLFHAKYVLIFDPLDGSSNIDFNVSVGTIFVIYERKSSDGPGTIDDVLQKGADIVAAGYMVYGSSTMFVYTAGHGVKGFTLDPSIGEFLLSHPDIQLPEPPKYYSVNQGYEKYWTEGIKRYTQWLQGEEGAETSLSLRYIGSMVADIHRTLLGGGVFYYPADKKDPKKPHGKLRLLYEANPMAATRRTARQSRARRCCRSTHRARSRRRERPDLVGTRR